MDFAKWIASYLLRLFPEHISASACLSHDHGTMNAFNPTPLFYLREQVSACCNNYVVLRHHLSLVLAYWRTVYIVIHLPHFAHSQPLPIAMSQINGVLTGQLTVRPCISIPCTHFELIICSQFIKGVRWDGKAHFAHGGNAEIYRGELDVPEDGKKTTRLVSGQ